MKQKQVITFVILKLRAEIQQALLLLYISTRLQGLLVYSKLKIMGQLVVVCYIKVVLWSIAIIIHGFILTPTLSCLILCL